VGLGTAGNAVLETGDSNVVVDTVFLVALWFLAAVCLESLHD
jgi:hypothetical protein